jgi:hypothetical protein
MRFKWLWVSLLLLVLLLLAVVYYLTHPLVFMDTHVHCIKIAGLQLERYADDHDGKYPSHPDGFGNALLLMDEECFHALTGPGYDASPLHDAKRGGRKISEDQCGRVYIQGLTKRSNPEIALLFDRLPTPGGDHCHLPMRFWAPLGREVWLIGMGDTFITESEWPEFKQKQVELLVKEGIERKEAERLYALDSQ